MEKRKVVKSGNTSYTLALPIEWIRKNRIEKGSSLTLSENETGEIVIFTGKTHTTPRNQVKTIKIDHREIEEIYVELLHAYIRNFSNIILEGKETPKKTGSLLAMLEELIGLDAIEQTPTSIVIKNFSSLDKETSPRPLIRKMDFGIRAMFELLKKFFKSGFSKDDYTELKRLQKQNVKIYYLARKVILKIIENPSLMRNYQTSHHQLSKDKVIAGALKQLSFILLCLGKALIYLEHKRKDIKLLKDFFISILKDYNIVLNSRRYKNYEETFDFLKKHTKKYGNWESYLKKTSNPLILESINYTLFINDILNEIAFEIVE